MKKKFLILAGMTASILSLTACGDGEDLGSMMGKAALNTVIGMGTVFIVLTLIIMIISCFSFIPKLQAALGRKKKEEPIAAQTVQTVAVQAAEDVDETDDLELVAVIAAAIAACEGAASADGFVVRSIIRRA